jgi:peptidoglycan/xylan/chitin deacetylase (PgdA/CDA1 family)
MTQTRFLTLLFAVALAVNISTARAAAQTCTQTVYLTFDTGSQSQAQLIADTLKKHAVKATFFLANEKTVKGDYSLDPSWAAYYQALAADGHVFGTHTFDHVFLQSSTATHFKVKPQFGPQSGKVQTWDALQYCAELKLSSTRFTELTGHTMHKLWRAPGGRVSDGTLAAAQACGYQHIGWQTAGVGAGFSGDELPSETYPNTALLNKSLNGLRDGDVFMAHLGIWSRKDAWAPAVLEPLIVGLKAKGTCFATLPEHPQYGNGKPIQTTVKF